MPLFFGFPSFRKFWFPFSWCSGLSTRSLLLLCDTVASWSSQLPCFFSGMRIDRSCCMWLGYLFMSTMMIIASTRRMPVLTTAISACFGDHLNCLFIWDEWLYHDNCTSNDSVVLYRRVLQTCLATVLPTCPFPSFFFLVLWILFALPSLSDCWKSHRELLGRTSRLEAFPKALYIGW